MASISIDSELMTNYVSSVPVPAGSHHVALLDQKRMPMVLCLSNDKQPRLRVLCRDEHGNSDMIDLHDSLNLPTDAVIQAFHASQSWSLKIYLCLAIRKDEDASELIVVKPFFAETLMTRKALEKLAGHQHLGTVQTIHMSPISGVNNDFKYPDIFLIHRSLDQSHSWGSDITHIQVSKTISSWIATNELNTPENASAILDITPAVSPYGQGLYVLYVTQGMTKIFARFLRPDPDAEDGAMFTFVTDVACPKGARCISTILDARGYTSLLIAAEDGIRILGVGKATSKDKPGNLLLGDTVFKNLRQLHVAQDESDVTIWFRTSRDELGYTRTKRENLAGSAITSLLLPAKHSTAFAPVVTRADPLTGDSTRQMLISNDSSGNLMLLEHTSDVGLWRRTPFHEPSATEATELKSYTVTIKAKQAANLPLASGAAYLSASSTLSIILNGRNILLTRVAQWYDCDTDGSLDFIIPSDTLSSQVFRIESLKTSDGDILDFKEVSYDPAAKPMAALAKKLRALQSGKAFAEVQTEKKESLFDIDVQKDEKTLDGALGCLQKTMQAYNGLPSSEKSSSSTIAPSRGVSTKLIVMAKESSDDFGDMILDGWFWIREQIDDVTEWFVDTAGSAWKFVCTIAGKIKTFILDCVEKVCEAASWVFEKLKVGWNKLVDFIGFIFSWDDILETKNTISSLLTAGFDYAAIKIDALAENVDGFFEGMEKTIDSLGESPASDKSIAEGDVGKKGESSDENSNNSTSSSWIGERLKNGGSSNIKIDTKDTKNSSEATDFFSKHVAPAMKKLEVEFEIIGSTLTAAFKKGKITRADLTKAAKALMKSGVIVVRGIVRGVFELLKTLIIAIRDFGNCEIKMPIVTFIWKTVLRMDRPCTIFDIISLIIAIPTTIMAKLITGKKPPTFEKLDGIFLHKLLENDKSVSVQTKRDFEVFKAEVVLGISVTTGAIAVIKLLYGMATLGLEDVVSKLPGSPSTFFAIFGICVDAIGTIMAIPSNMDLPGAAYRNWIAAITFTRGAYHTIAFFIPSKTALEPVILSLDLLSVLANFGLSIAVGVAEHKAGSSWKNYDETDTNIALTSATLNAVAGVAYFTAFVFKLKNPVVSAVGAAVMIGTLGGATVLKGAIFESKYKKLDNDGGMGMVDSPAF